MGQLPSTKPSVKKFPKTSHKQNNNLYQLVSGNSPPEESTIEIQIPDVVDMSLPDGLISHKSARLSQDSTQTNPKLEPTNVPVPGPKADCPPELLYRTPQSHKDSVPQSNIIEILESKSQIAVTLNQSSTVDQKPLEFSIEKSKPKDLDSPTFEILKIGNANVDYVFFFPVNPKGPIFASPGR